MIATASESTSWQMARSKTTPSIAELLSPDRVAISIQVSSKKRLLEEIARLFTVDNSHLNKETVFQVLCERERLGSTGIGGSVALPHGRVNGLESALAVAATLKSPLDYDTIDQQPINIVFGLLVPAEAKEEHIRILAHLARMFSDEQLKQNILNVETSTEAYDKLSQWHFEE